MQSVIGYDVRPNFAAKSYVSNLVQFLFAEGNPISSFKVCYFSKFAFLATKVCSENGEHYLWYRKVPTLGR